MKRWIGYRTSADTLSVLKFLSRTNFGLGKNRSDKTYLHLRRPWHGDHLLPAKRRYPNLAQRGRRSHPPHR